MKAIRVEQPGGPEVLQVADIDQPQPSGGDVRVKIAACGVNFIDIYHRTALYPLPLPFTPGLEAAGVVDAIGPDVTLFKVGDQVAYCSQLGAYAEYALVPQEKLVTVPAGVDLATAAAVMLQGMTAHYLLYSTFPLQAGQTMLVHAAAGGVGLLLVQLAKQIGATIIGTVSTEEKAALARKAGADHIILYSQTDFVAETKRLTADRGVDVVYDGVGQATFEGSLNSLRPRGYMVLFGQASGPVPPFDLGKLNRKGSLFITRPGLFVHISKREEFEWRTGDLFKWIGNGMLNVRVNNVLPLSEASQAHSLLASRQTAGKLLLRP